MSRQQLAAFLAALAGLLAMVALVLAPERLTGILRDLRRGPS